jgi:ABC-type sugar transport system ATPase subunit
MPAALYHTPDNLFVARFLGSPPMNLLPSVVHDGVARLPSGHRLPLDVQASGNITLGIRPEDLRITAAGRDDTFAGEVSLVEELGETRIVHVSLADGSELVVRDRSEPPPRRGERVTLHADAGRYHAFGPDGQRISQPPARQ